MNHKEIKTGRNLPLATAVSLLLVGILAASLWFDRWFFAVTISLVAYFATKEMFRLLDIQDRLIQFLLLFSAITLPILTYARGLSWLALALLPRLFLSVGLALRGGFHDFTHRISSVLLSVVYVPVLLGFMVDLARYDNGFALVFSLALLNSAVDTGGYFAGILFGKRPLFKELSPKKTVEGLFGSIALALFAALVLVPLLVPIQIWQGIVLSFAVVLGGVVGDLFESAMKRERGLKDASHAIPGHGGVLDRIDALLFNAPIVWLFFLGIFEVGVL
jgi:phosphatidate cytidylyltransferase